MMKQPEYIEGPKARENFERGMIALFKVPKTAIGKARKKGRKLTAPRPFRMHAFAHLFIISGARYLGDVLARSVSVRDQFFDFLDDGSVIYPFLGKLIGQFAV